MDDRDIQVFITSVLRYFEALESDSGVFIEPPFIKDHGKPFREYSGLIRVSGKSSGIVCFTASKTMLEAILKHLNQDPATWEAIADLVGEIANTLSGNAREEFGRDFMISVPVVSVGDHVETMFPHDTRNYVIPIIWRLEKAFLFVSLT